MKEFWHWRRIFCCSYVTHNAEYLAENGIFLDCRFSWFDYYVTLKRGGCKNHSQFSWRWFVSIRWVRPRNIRCSIRAIQTCTFLETAGSHRQEPHEIWSGGNGQFSKSERHSVKTWLEGVYKVYKPIWYMYSEGKWTTPQGIEYSLVAVFFSLWSRDRLLSLVHHQSSSGRHLWQSQSSRGSFALSRHPYYDILQTL